jgi:hypothetical protein
MMSRKLVSKTAAPELLVEHHLPVKRDGRLDAGDGELFKCRGHLVDGAFPGLRVHMMSLAMRES